MTDRDPSVDHYDELYPDTRHVEDLSDIRVVAADGRIETAPGENVDDNGVAHFLRMTPDADEPDRCGGCGREWPCPDRQPLQVVERPRLDPELVRAVAEALRAEQAAGRLAL